MIQAFLNMDKLPLILIFIVILLGYLLYRAHFSDSNFDLTDMLTDSTTGKASLNKLGQFIALVLSSWGFLYLTLQGKLTEVYFTTYMAAWSGVTLINNAIKSYKEKSMAKTYSDYANSEQDEDERAARKARIEARRQERNN